VADLCPWPLTISLHEFHVHLLCVGEAFRDVVFLDLRALPREGEEIRTNRFVETIGGGAVITAVTASRLGLRSTVISQLAPDAVARLRAERVGVTNLRRPREAPAVSVALSTRRDRTFVTYNGANNRLEARILAMGRALNAPFVHFALAPRHCSRWARLMRRLRAQGTITSWDFGWSPQLLGDRGFVDLLASVDYVFVNRQVAVVAADQP